MEHGHRFAALALVTAALAVASSSAGAQRADTAHAHVRSRHVAARSGQAALRAQAKISEDSARAIALREVPTGKVRSAELEREHGRLIYSFDVGVAGKSGVEEVNVDARTGAVVAHEHESAAAERREARAEQKPKKPR